MTHARRALYFAYGANTNLRSMALRCPAARPVAAATLSDSRLVFRGVADVEQEEGTKVFGALWEITPECEVALDRFEGFPRLYVKTYFPVQLHGQKRDVMMYVMRDQREQRRPPYDGYLETLREGYRHFGLPQEQLDRAIEVSRPRPKQIPLWIAPPGAKGRDGRGGWKRGRKSLDRSSGRR